jgi:NDP-sugar pyrophosphorylase family protein
MPQQSRYEMGADKTGSSADEWTHANPFAGDSGNARSTSRTLLGVVPVGILCGGLGTRVESLADDLPKSLIPLAGEPFLAHQLRRLRDEGVRDVVLLTGHRSESIETYAGDGSAFGLRVRYSPDGPELRGTAGAVKRALPLLGERFFTLYGDSLLDAALQPILDAFTAPYEGVMTVYRNADRDLPSNATVGGERILHYEKNAAPGTMTHIDYGLNAFRAGAFAEIPDGGSVDLSVVHRAMIARGTLRAFPIAERWHEIGSPEGLAETERYIASRSAKP